MWIKKLLPIILGSYRIDNITLRINYRNDIFVFYYNYTQMSLVANMLLPTLFSNMH
jgi:hypothetical protein